MNKNDNKTNEERKMAIYKDLDTDILNSWFFSALLEGDIDGASKILNDYDRANGFGNNEILEEVKKHLRYVDNSGKIVTRSELDKINENKGE